MTVEELADLVRRGAYEVDEREVAEAILRHPGARRLLLARDLSDDVLESGD